MSVRVTIILNIIFSMGIVYKVMLQSVRSTTSVRHLQIKSEALQIETEPLLNDHL